MLESAHTNQAVSDDLAVYPSHMRLTVDHLQTIAQITTAGMTPRFILVALRENDPTCVTVSKDVYNAKQHASNIAVYFNVGSDLIRCLISRFGMKQLVGICPSGHCWISSKIMKSSIILSAQ